MNWSHYDLAARYTSRVALLCGRYGASPEDAEEIAHSAAIALCLSEDPGGDNQQSAIKAFFRICRTEISRRSQMRAREPGIMRFAPKTMDFATENTIADYLGAATPPSQLSTVFVSQCLSHLDRLPSAHRHTMRRLAIGDTAADIAIRDGVAIEEVLARIRVAREWVREHMEWLDDAA